MIPFKAFFEKIEALGLIETLNIDGIGPVPAKVDSGNGAFNVIHGAEVSVSGSKSGQKTVKFTTVNDKVVEKIFKGYIDINIGSGNIEQRPTILLDLEVHGKRHENIPFSIADRSQNEEKALLGKDFIIRLGGLIDVTK